ncbi:hypothetical protein G9A89_001283, partial [Geosiphon pyriformis]
MEPSFNIGVKSTESRKKRKDGVLEDNIGNRKFATTKSNNMDIEEKCLVKETSFDHKDGRALTGENSKQISKSSRIHTKKTLGKPLGKINFLGDNIDDILLNKPVSFTLDINLDNIVKKSIQEKLVVVRKLFSKINSFGEIFTSSKFAGIIRAMFTSELSLVQASKKAVEIKILVNSDLKKSFECSDWAVVLKKIPVETSTEAVHAVLSGFGVVMSIKMQLVGLWQKAIVEFSKSEQANLVTVYKELWDMRNQHRALLYTLSIGTTAYNIWDYIGSVNGKTCTINHHSVMYAQAKCTVVCFKLANSLNAVIEITSVLRSVNMYWSPLDFSKCIECERLSHISLGCAIGVNFSSEKSSHRPFSDINKSRLATIYAKHLVLIAHPVAFGGVFWAKIVGENAFLPLSIKPILPDISDVEKRFTVLESSLASLMEQISELAKRLNLFMLANQVSDVVMKKGLSETTNGETAATLDSFASLEVKKLENMLERLSASVLRLYAGALLVVWFFQAGKINSFIVKAVNKFSFVILDGDFNKDGTWKYTSFKKCFDLGLVNSLRESLFVKTPMWTNFCGVTKALNYILIFSCLVNAIVDDSMADVEDYFNTNHKAVYASMNLG